MTKGVRQQTAMARICVWWRRFQRVESLESGEIDVARRDSAPRKAGAPRQSWWNQTREGRDLPNLTILAHEVFPIAGDL